MSDDPSNEKETRILSSFDKYDDCLALTQELLAVDSRAIPSEAENNHEELCLIRLHILLNEYQEQPYLLDPHLEELVVPVADALRNHARESTLVSEKDVHLVRINRLALVLHQFVKVRGYKMIIRFFPHAVSDLPIALSYMSSTLTSLSSDQESRFWALRYAVRLWLALVCMLPFDLHQFDQKEEGETARMLEGTARAHLSMAGLERDGAALMLSRLYMRKDTHSLLDPFLGFFRESIDKSDKGFLYIGVLQVLAEMAKSAPSEVLQAHASSIQKAVSIISETPSIVQNTIVRRYRVKVLSRLAMRRLPGKARVAKRAGKALLVSDSSQSTEDEVEDENLEVPCEVENTFEDIFEALQDKDTLVRWSAAKNIARIAERLPLSYADQVLDNILSFFTIHIADLDSLSDNSASRIAQELPAAAEQPWHGATLACAEMTRHGLVRANRLADVLGWMSRALFFDVRRGANSVGSTVRDAASYVIWSLARTKNPDALHPYATTLAQKLVTVSCYDRDIQIRRAASAAFQENVGRMGLFPHGIDVLGKMDFFAVSNRRNSFLVAAPQVAEHKEYRPYLIDHLFNITLRHWDESMRVLGAESLRKLAVIDLADMLPDMVTSCGKLIRAVDITDIHGGLLALTELAKAISGSVKRAEQEVLRQQIFANVKLVPETTISSPRNFLTLEASCNLIASTLELHDLKVSSSESEVPYWRTIVDLGLKHRNSRVQEAAAAATLRLSTIEDCSKLTLMCNTQIQVGRRGSPPAQQSLARLLGYLNYTAWPHSFRAALSCLLQGVDISTPQAFSDVEARQIAYQSLARIISCIRPKLPDYLSQEEMASVFNAFIAGMNDYTINERGDVGSWVRIACTTGLCSIIQDLIGRASLVPDSTTSQPTSAYQLIEYLPIETYHRAIGAILKQGVERLDNVRQQAGDTFLKLLALAAPPIEGGERWVVAGRDTLANVLSPEDGLAVGWNDGSWLFPRAVRFLDIEEYRVPVLRGLLMSIASKTGSTERPASIALVNYVQSLPQIAVNGGAASYTSQALAKDLLTIATTSPSSNNIVVPVLQAFNVLLEGEVLTSLEEDDDGSKILDELLTLATRNVDRLKSPQRIVESMKIVVNLLPVISLRTSILSKLGPFLQHRFPKIRSDTAEALYLVLQTKDLEYEDKAEDILLETDWSTNDSEALQQAVAQLLSCFPS